MFDNNKEATEFFRSVTDEAVRRVYETHEICAEIEVYPDYFKVRFEPWKPFEYTCPYKEKS